MTQPTRAPKYLSFEGQCTLEDCPSRGEGHWLKPVTMLLKTNPKRTDFWYESTCAPGRRQQIWLEGPQGALHQLRNLHETMAYAAALGVPLAFGAT